MDVLRVMNQIHKQHSVSEVGVGFPKDPGMDEWNQQSWGLPTKKTLFTTKKNVFPMSFGLVLRTKGSEIWDRVHVTGKDDRKRPLVGA